MNTTIRERIIRSIVTALESSMPGELGGLQDWRSVDRGRMEYEPEELPAITVVPGQEAVSRVQSGRNTMAMEVSVQAIFPTALPAVAGEGASELGEAILGALRSAVEGGDRTCGGLADDLAYASGGIVSYPMPTEQHTIVEAVFRITYRTLLGDPYNQ